MPNLPEAQAIVRKVAPTLSVNEQAFVVAIAGLESSLGEGFLPAHNWGAETAGQSWTGATFDHEDSRWTPDGVVRYVTKFKDYPDDDSAAAGLVALLRARYSRALRAAKQGQWTSAARALYDAGYFKGVKPPREAVADYAASLITWLRKQGIVVAATLGMLELGFWTALAIGAAKVVRKR